MPVIRHKEISRNWENYKDKDIKDNSVKMSVYLILSDFQELMQEEIKLDLRLLIIWNEKLFNKEIKTIREKVKDVEYIRRMRELLEKQWKTNDD